MSNQNEQNKSLASFQNVRAILSLAYIDSKIPKSTLMKIEIKQVLETVNKEIDLLLFRNGGNFLCAISRIIQKKCSILMQELKDFYDNFKNKGISQPNKKPNPTSAKKNRTLLRSAIPDGDSSIFNNSTASIEELSNTSIQFPRNIASKDKITMQSIITPFRGNKQTELVGSSNLLTSEKFSDDPALSSGMADILGGKSSLIRSLNGDLKKSPLFDSDTNGQFSEELPMIVIHNEDHQSINSNLDVSISSNIPITNNNRIGEIAEAVQNQNSALSFRERLEKSKVQSEKKQKQKTYYDEDILLRQDNISINLLNEELAQIQIEEFQNDDKIHILSENLPDNLLKKALLDKIAKNLIKITLNEKILESVEKPKFIDSEKTISPFAFTFKDHENAVLEENEEEKNEQNETENNVEIPLVEHQNQFLEADEKSDSYPREMILSNKNINELEDSINQKLLRKINELTEERQINDFERLYQVTKDRYSKAQLFLELLQLVRHDKIIMNQNNPFGKITFGLL